MKLAFVTREISLSAWAPYGIGSFKASCCEFVWDDGCTFLGYRSTSVLAAGKEYRSACSAAVIMVASVGMSIYCPSDVDEMALSDPS
eukprot:Nk52_evm7s208 gene=Nk52_evmTU7s208